MNFLEPDDLKTNLRTYRLDQILEDEAPEDADAILDQAESEALATIRDALVANYDVSKIFGKSGSGRDQNVVRWAKCLLIYYIFERVPDEMVPDRVIENYRETTDILQSIADGKRSVDLPRLVKSDGTPKTKFRWGSQTKRSH